MKQATRERIGNWIERNRLYVLSSSAVVFLLGLLIGDTPLGVLIRVISIVIVILFVFPIEMMIDGIG